jgi:hypothetical protein
MNKHFRFSGSTLQRLEELGVRAPAVLRRAGLPQAFIHQARALLNTEELFALWRAVGEISTDPSIGLLLGTETKTERFHPIGLAALSSESFGSAIDQMARYKQLTCPEEILQEKDDEEWIQQRLPRSPFVDRDNEALKGFRITPRSPTIHNAGARSIQNPGRRSNSMG